MKQHTIANEKIGDTCPAALALNSLFSRKYPHFVAYPWKLRFDRNDLNKNTAPDIYVYELDADGDFVKNKSGSYRIEVCYALNGKNAVSSSRSKLLNMDELENGDFKVTLENGNISTVKKSIGITDENTSSPSTAKTPGGLGLYLSEIEDLSYSKINSTKSIPPDDMYDEEAPLKRMSNVSTMGSRMEDGIAIGLTQTLNADKTHPMREGYTGDLIAMSTSQIDKKWLQKYSTNKYPSKEYPDSEFKHLNNDIVKRWQDKKGIDIVIFPAKMFKRKECPFITFDGEDNNTIETYTTVQVKMEARALVQYGTYFIECNTRKGKALRADSGINKTLAKWWCFHDSAVEATLIPTDIIREFIYGKELQHISDKEKADNEWDPMGVRIACRDVLQHKQTCSTILPDLYVKAYKKISYDLLRKTVYDDTKELLVDETGNKYRSFEYAVGQDLTFEEKKALFEGTLKASRIRKMRT